MSGARGEVFTTAGVTRTDETLQLRNRAQGRGVESVIARLGADVRAGSLEVGGDAERRCLRIALEGQVGGVDLANAGETYQSLAQQGCRLNRRRWIDAAQPDV